MATLTYDPTPADQPEFSEEEMDSLAVGERIAQEENQLLAGKYEDAQQLEKAYLELQGKLGQQQPEEEEVEEEQVEASDEEYEETDDDEDSGNYELTEADIEAIYEMVGGEQEYSNMIAWAGENLSELEVNMYDHVMDLGDPYAVFFAVRALGNSYQNATGVDGELLTGSAPTNPQQGVFRSQAEVVRAMEDPRYDSDPAYRQDVFDALDRSNIQF
tara:strand:- start:354 stop:1001 length:648 start_codon:yes stop_codon:yes gene_type:complete